MELVKVYIVPIRLYVKFFSGNYFFARTKLRDSKLQLANSDCLACSPQINHAGKIATVWSDDKYIALANFIAAAIFFTEIYLGIASGRCSVIRFGLLLFRVFSLRIFLLCILFL